MFSYKQRRILSLIILLVWLPVYIVVFLNLMTYLERLSPLIELIVYVIAGVLWVLPFKFIFKGVGKEEPKK